MVQVLRQCCFWMFLKAYKKRAKEQLRKKMDTLYGTSFTAMLLLDVFLEKL